MKHFIFIISSLIVLFCFLLIPLYAQEKEVTLEKVVVTATRDVEEIRKIPANVTVITKKQIEESNAKTVVDLLRDQVGSWSGIFMETEKLPRSISEVLEKRLLSIS